MNHKLAFSSAILVLATGSLTGCQGEPNTITPGADTPTAQAEATTVTPTPTLTLTPTPTPTVKLSGNFGDKITFPSGVSVTVARPFAVPAGQYAYGAVEGKIVNFELSVTNGSKEAIDAGLMGYPRVTYGPKGLTAENASSGDPTGGSLSTIPPGETQTITLSYGIPSAAFKDVRMKVDGPTFEDKPAIFKGAVR